MFTVSSLIHIDFHSYTNINEKIDFKIVDKKKLTSKIIYKLLSSRTTSFNLITFG